MSAECTRTKMLFHGLDKRPIVAQCEDGLITSGACGVRTRELERRTWALLE